MPLIAFTSGCDPAECFLRHSASTTASSSRRAAPTPAHVRSTTRARHFYTAYDARTARTPARSRAATRSTDTYAWWTTRRTSSSTTSSSTPASATPTIAGAGRLRRDGHYLARRRPPLHDALLRQLVRPPTGRPTSRASPAGPPEAQARTTILRIHTTFPKGKAFASGSWRTASRRRPAAASRFT